MKTEDKLTAGFIVFWILSLLICLAFWGLIGWGIVELILWLRAN